MTLLRVRQNNLGFNLIEAALVLGIAGIVIGAIFAAWGSVSAQSRLRRAEDQVTVIVNQIRSTYGNRAQLDDAPGSTFTNALIAAGLLPDNWLLNISGSQQIGNPYGGSIVITPESTQGSSTKDAIQITMTQLEKADCMKLAAHVLGNGRGEGLFKVDSSTVNNTSTFRDIQGSVCQSHTVIFTFTLRSGT